MIPAKFFEDVDYWMYEKIYCWVSGGKDSTVLALSLYDNQDKLNAPVELVHTNTGLRLKTAEATLHKLKKYTRFPLIELAPTFPKKPNLILESFKKLNQAEEAKKQGKYDRRIFPCCEELKHRPGKKFIKSIPIRQRERYIFLSAITQYESRRRAWFLLDLAKQNKYIIMNQKMHAFFGYPFRDLRAPKKTDKVLKEHGFDDTRHSGCRICPILLLFDLHKIEPERWIKSQRYYLSKVKEMKICVKS